MQNFRDLKVWRKSHKLTLAAYEATKGFPKEERYGLTGQIRRAAASVPSNIAEGCCRNSNPEFARFLQIGMGSASELEYHFLLARDLGLLDAEQHEELQDELVEVKRMLAVPIQRVRAKN